MKTTAVVVIVVLAIVSAACGVTGPSLEPAIVRVRGSDTMLILNRRLATAFMRQEPTTAIRVAGGGSGAGIDALIAGTTDLAAVSRPLVPGEVQRLFEATGSLGLRVLVARDGLSVFVHPDNPVRDLTLAELRRVFSGEIRRWDRLGGDAVAVGLVVRPPNSGSARFFRDHVLRGEPFPVAVRVEPTTRAVVAAVAAGRGAIGFGGLAYRTDEVVAVRLEGAAPTPASVRDETYPLSRYLQLVAVQPPEGPARRFVDFCLAAEGQRIVAEAGYVPLWPVP